jgi:predicted transcriptional regulator
MTKRKPGAVRGRPSSGLDVQVGVRLSPEMVEQLDAAAAEENSDRSAVLRALVERWAKRRLAKR